MSKAPAEDPTPIGELSYEQARDELLSVVGQLETGGVPLEQTMTLWERGEALADRCQSLLDGAAARLRQASEDTGRPDAD